MKIALSIDGLIAPSSDPLEPLPDKPYTGAAAFTQELINRGHYLVIHDTRANCVGCGAKIWSWLISNGIAFNDVWVLSGKPDVDVFLEPRSPEFKRDYAALLKVLE